MPRSKRLSGSKRSSSPTPQLELFVDRSLGRRTVPDRLRREHAVVIAHDEVFPQDTDDEVWLREAGRRRWIVLMKDRRVRYRPGEQRAIIEEGVRSFCLHRSKGLSGPQMAEILAAALPAILRYASEKADEGYIVGVDREGRYEDYSLPRRRRGERSDGRWRWQSGVAPR